MLRHRCCQALASATLSTLRYQGSSGSGNSTHNDSNNSSCPHPATSSNNSRNRISDDVITDSPKPPRPAFYVPPSERAADDASLDFLPGRTRGVRPRGGGPGPGPGHPLAGELKAAPEIPAEAAARAHERRTARQYSSADAARLHSTSVYAGKSVLEERTVLADDVYYHATTAADGGSSSGGGGERLPPSPASPEAFRRPSMFHARDEHIRLEDLTGDTSASATGSGSGSATEAKIDKAEGAGAVPLEQQMALDLKRLEYYQGTAEHARLLAEFQAKYTDEALAKASRSQRPESYTDSERAQGLETQPLDYLRSSPQLQMQLSAGPRAYDPVTIMQQHGVMRYQGYAFPPSVELGKLKGAEDAAALQAAHTDTGAVALLKRVRKALTGRADTKNDYVASTAAATDNSLVYRVTGLDAVQRRQMRYMLSDFDAADRFTAFHVMMTYPYTDWIHAFYMVLVGWALYQLQVRWGAYEFYDEYLGLDLRQVPRMQKPVLALITVTVMMFLLFQPLLVASIATTRAYRIALRRPIGPP